VRPAYDLASTTHDWSREEDTSALRRVKSKRE
jgi:hypothetical protein